MLLDELPARLADEFSYPVDLETVVGRLGAVEVETPDRTDPDTIRTILQPLGVDTFDTPAALYATIYGSVSDRYVGRKFYDDRGGSPTGDEEGPHDDVNVSF